VITSPATRNLLALLYLAAALVIADQVADLVATLLATSPTPGLASWRFGAFGLIASRASVFLIADVMLFSAAIGLGHRLVLRVLGIVHLVIAAGLLAGLIVFALDWIQVRGRVNPGAKRHFDLAALRSVGIGSLGLTMLAWAGVVALKASRGRPKSARREGEASPLLTDLRRDESAS
jgi:hypothetical protein